MQEAIGQFWGFLIHYGLVVDGLRGPVETTADGSDAPAIANASCAVKPWSRGWRKPVVGIVKGGEVKCWRSKHEVEYDWVDGELWLIVSRGCWVADVRAAGEGCRWWGGV